MLLHAPIQSYKRLQIKSGQNDRSSNSSVNRLSAKMCCLETSTAAVQNAWYCDLEAKRFAHLQTIEIQDVILPLMSESGDAFAKNYLSKLTYNFMQPANSIKFYVISLILI